MPAYGECDCALCRPPDPTIERFYCYDCSGFEPISERTTIDGYGLCARCAARAIPCAMCETRTRRNYRATRNRRVCAPCARNSRACYRCSNYMEAAEAVTVDNEPVCPDCMSHIETCAACNTQTLNAYAATRGRRICHGCARYGMACDSCSQYTDDRSELVVIDGYSVCAPCLADRARQCGMCDNRTMRHYRATRGRRACRSCANSHPHCERCNEYMDQDEGETLGRDRVCTSCMAHVETCSGCSTRTLSAYSCANGDRVCNTCARRMQRCGYCSLYAERSVPFTSVQDRQPVCESCLEAVFTQCDDCEEWHGIYDRCSECYPEDEDEDYDSDNGSYGGRVHYYSYKPDPEFHGQDSKAYLGLELEVARTNYKCAELVSDALGGLGYMKEDSSINGGFEIVTHPMTHAYACESFPWDMLEQLASEGARADDSCGIHVHVSREGFDSASHRYRWMKLFYRNENGVCGIARRRGSSWARFSSDERKNVKEYAKANGGQYGQRYSVINVQNDATFEIRAFRSSLVKQEVQAALDLVAASVEYTRNLTVPTIISGGWTWDAFRAWVAERPEYTALSEEMAKCAS